MLIDFLGGLAQNIALLLSLTLLYSVVRPYWTRAAAPVQSVVAGVLFGLIAIVSMHTPFVVAPGVISDARVIPVLLAGPFGGVGAAAVAGSMAAVYRASLGGAGAAAGVGTILTTALLGALVAWRWRARRRRLTAPVLLLLGVALDAIMLAWVVALPSSEVARQVLGAAAVPVGLFLPFGTVVLGMLLVNESRRQDERERLALTQVAFDRAADALLWIARDGRLVNVNPAAERLTGYRRDELLARRVWELEVGTTAAGWRAFWAATREARSRATETRYRRSDGTELPVETTNDFVAWHGREWISVFVRDISERRRVEAERARHLAAVEEASVLKDQFLATLSHELRTPLTSILGYARLLRSGTLGDAARERALATIERNTRAQAQIIDDLLEVSAIVCGDLRLERRPLDLATLVVSEAKGARQESSSDVALVCETTGPVVVLGDETRLRQVVRNLVTNAFKFTPPGGRVTIRVFGNREEARIVVQDTGIGIAPAFLPHLFDRFRQADGSLTRTYGGLGIGLAIVRHLAEAHGGRAEATSAGEGRGATFTVRLPLAQQRLDGANEIVGIERLP